MLGIDGDGDDAGDRLSRAARQARRAAAIGIRRAEIADDVAAARRLADEDAGRSPRRAGAAAARSAAGGQSRCVEDDAAVGGGAPAELPVDDTAVGRAARWGRAARAGGPPGAMVRVPVQQSVPVEHASPGCPQNDDAWHVPFEQRFEQQSAPVAHWVPSVLHTLFSGAHVPPTQL